METIVADGGSSDGTGDIAERLGALVISAERGRAASSARKRRRRVARSCCSCTPTACFPPAGLAPSPRRSTVMPRFPAATFASFSTSIRLSRDGSRRSMPGLAFALYYGDSGIFVRREVYEKIGGVKPMALMEDYEFVRRLERAGRTCRIDDPPLLTSARRFTNRPWLVALWGWTRSISSIGSASPPSASHAFMHATTSGGFNERR